MLDDQRAGPQGIQFLGHGIMAKPHLAVQD